MAFLFSVNIFKKSIEARYVDPKKNRDGKMETKVPSYIGLV